MKKKRSLFEYFLFEAKCPICGAEGAYVGANKISCDNCGGDWKKKDGDQKAPASKAGQTIQHGSGGTSYTNTGNNLYDHFSKDFNEYKRSIEREAERIMGKDFRDRIDQGFGKKGAYDKALKELWDKNYSDYEGLGEIGFWFDVVQNGDVDTYGRKGSGPWIEDRYDLNYDGDRDPRKSRPMSPADF